MIIIKKDYNKISYFPYLDKIKTEGQRRWDQKRHFNSSVWIGSTPHLSHTYGLSGEVILAVDRGKPELVDWELRCKGDPGSDFKDIDVKTATFIDDPDLKEFTLDHPSWQRKIEKGKFPAKYYVLVALDVKNHEGWVCGWCKAREIFSAPTKSYGKEPRHYINHTELKPIETLPIALEKA